MVRRSSAASAPDPAAAGPSLQARGRWRLLAVWLTFSLGLLSNVAQADSGEATRIVVIVDQPSQSVASRVATELGTMGFDAVVVLVDSEGPEVLSTITRQQRAVAGARILFLGRTIRLWLLDRTTGKTLMRELEASDGAHDGRLALHTVELLRASLLELKLPNAPKGELEASESLLSAARVPKEPALKEAAAGPAPAASARAPAGVPSEPSTEPAARLDHAAPDASEEPFLSVEVGPAVVGAQGDLEPFPALLARVAWFAWPELRFGVSSFVPLAGMNHEASEGSSESRVTLIGIDARWQGVEGLLRPSLGFGVTLGLLQTRGQATWNSLESDSDSARGLGGSFSSSLGVRLSRYLYLTPQVSAGIQLAYFVIDYGERAAATWGPLWGAGALALEGRFE